MKILRPPQVEARERLRRSVAATGMGLVSMPTGIGKTALAVKIMEDRAHLGPSAFIAPRQEIIHQTVDAIKVDTLLSVGVEHADLRVSLPPPDITVCSVQTLGVPERLARFPRNLFATIFADEAHHYSREAPMFARVLEHFIGARIGLTATPDRLDGSPLMFGPVTYRYGLRAAIREKYLADLYRVVVPIPDFSPARVAKHRDWTDAELEAELIKEPAVRAVVDALLLHAGTRLPTIAFCAGRAHSHAVAAALNTRRPGCAAGADGENRQGLADFVAGRVQFVANADLATEGFDHPPTSCVALVRPTKSLGRATQQIGRGTRRPEGKDRCTVIEFVGAINSGQISTVDVVGSDLPQRVRAAAELLLDRSPTLSVLDALERAAATAGCNVITTAPRRERAVLDPMRLILSLDGMVMEAPRPGAVPATPVQIAKLEAAGLRVAGLSARQAQMLLNGIAWRRNHRDRYGRSVPLSSPVQALSLAALGFPADVPAVEAMKTLAQMQGVAA